MNVITKSGSNAFNGSLGTYYTNNSLQSKNYFQKQATGFSHPDYGRTELPGLGGPVQRNRTFFFTSGDVLRSDVAVSGARTILTPAFIRFMEQARPGNVSTYIAKNFPASFAPDRNFRTAGQHLNAACSGSTPITSPIGSVPCDLQVTGRDVERDLAEKRPAVYGTGRPQPERGEGPHLWLLQPDHYGQGGIRDAGGVSGLHGGVADQQHALQHELDPDHLLVRAERGIVRLGQAVGVSCSIRARTFPASP